MHDPDALRSLHVARFHAEPEIVVAPGRVNLIGEHTDYNDGFVMPFALDQRITIAGSTRDDGIWSVTSLDNDDTQTFIREDLSPGMEGWQAYVAGVVWALLEEGHDVRAADLRERIKTLRRALLVMHSPTDNTVGIANASDIFRAARHPRSFVSLEGADHLLTGKNQAARAARIISAWADPYL
jgi:pimeloyl-ACP methyl ester carboxylesterase